MRLSAMYANYKVGFKISAVICSVSRGVYFEENTDDCAKFCSKMCFWWQHTTNQSGQLSWMLRGVSFCFRKFVSLLFHCWLVVRDYLLQLPYRKLWKTFIVMDTFSAYYGWPVSTNDRFSQKTMILSRASSWMHLLLHKHIVSTF